MTESTTDTAEDTADDDGPTGRPADSSGTAATDADGGDAGQPGEAAVAAESTDGPAVSGSKLVAFAEYAAFGILCLLALVATFRFYFAAAEAIRLWFSPDFVPVFQAAFNLVVLIAAAVGVSVLVRRFG